MSKSTPFFIVAFLLAFLLMIVPLPDAIENFRPHWFLLVMAAWILSSEKEADFAVIWLLSIVVDLLMGSRLGLHSLSLVPSAYILYRFAPRFSLLSTVQQILFIFILALWNAYLPVWVASWHMWSIHATEPTPAFGRWLLESSVITALIWPIFSHYFVLSHHAISKT